MGKKIIIVGLLAAILSTGGVVYAQNTDIGRTLVISAGAGGYFGYQFVHQTFFADGQSPFDNIDTDSVMMAGGPLFVRVDLLTYLALEASAFYKMYLDSDSISIVSAVFSVYGQFPREVAPGITLFPFIGVGYEMPFFGFTDDEMATRSDFENNNDDLLLKLGLGLNGNLTRNLRLSFRLGYDVVLYNKVTSEYAKLYSNYGTFINLRHTPNVFLGLSYAFLKI